MTCPTLLSYMIVIWDTGIFCFGLHLSIYRLNIILLCKITKLIEKSVTGGMRVVGPITSDFIIKVFLIVKFLYCLVLIFVCMFSQSQRLTVL